MKAVDSLTVRPHDGADAIGDSEDSTIGKLSRSVRARTPLNRERPSERSFILLMVARARGGQRWRWRGEIRRDMIGEGTPDTPISASTTGRRGRDDKSVISPDRGPQDVAIEVTRQ